MEINPVVFREYDVRGVYEKDFDLGFARNLGRALVTHFTEKGGFKNPRIVIGMDARKSSPAIVEAVSEGITMSGGDVLKIGLVTSPVAYFTTFYYEDVDGCVMITGSHNPPEYNGFKLSMGKGSLYGQAIKDLEKIMRAERYLSGKGKVSERDVFPDYLAKHKKEFGDLSGVKVVLDCGNGAGGSIARRLYETVGVTPTILFEEPDGDFPNHHPDPTVEKNLAWLKDEVLKQGAAMGIGFDGDADRIGVVDENGQMVHGDELIACFAKMILSEHPGSKIIGDVKCSDRLYDYIKKYGGEPIMWMTGHSLIKQKIKDEVAPFGGELSGHVFFSDRNYGYDDALYAGLRLIEMVKRTGKTLRQYLSDYPSAHNTPEIRIDTTEEKKLQIVDRLREHFKRNRKELTLNLIDGIRVSYPDGWGLARASNTQPVLVLRYEASTPEGMERIRKDFEEIVNPML